MVGLHTGERSRITLGSWPALSINDARAAAREVRRKVEEGRNPNEERRNLARGADPRPVPQGPCADAGRSEEHTSELQSLMRISYAVFCLQQKRACSTERTSERDISSNSLCP